MYPDLDLARNRIAELHHLAERSDLAIALGRARRARSDRPGHATPARSARAVRRGSPSGAPAAPNPATSAATMSYMTLPHGS